MPYDLNIDALANPDVLDRVIDWKLRSPAHMRRMGRKLSALTEGVYMQRQFSVELRVDYADPEKNEVMRSALKAAARHIYATASLLSDTGMKPEISVFSDDFFAGHEEIKMLEDTIQQGIDETGSPDEAPISNELLAAAGGVGE